MGSLLISTTLPKSLSFFQSTRYMSILVREIVERTAPRAKDKQQ